MKSDEIRTESGSGQELNRVDVVLAMALFVLALALRIPFRSHFAYHWDSAQFAFAVSEYNIRINQPHPPGYYWYILLGRMLNFWVGEPHAALVWLSVIAGAWLVAAGYLLATSMFGRRAGLGTGLILLTSPLCWFHSEIALSTIVDSALVVSFVFVCWRAMQRGTTWFRIFSMAAWLAVVAGVRQMSAPLLIPLWLYVMWRSARPRGCKILCALALLAGFSLLWFIPTVKSAGGFTAYLHLLRLKSQIDAPRIVWGSGGVKAFLIDVNSICRACWMGVLGAGVILLVEFSYWFFPGGPATRGRFCRVNRAQFEVLALWVAPMVLFGLLMYVAMPGHVLNFFPAMAMLAALALVRFAERLMIWFKIGRSSALWCVYVLMAGFNAIVFIWAPSWTTPLQFGLPLTGVEIRQHDLDLSRCFQAIRSKWSPGDVVIYHRVESFYWGFPQFGYYLPEYRNVLLGNHIASPGTQGRKAWIEYMYHTTFQGEFEVPDEKQCILVVPPGQSIDLFNSPFDVSKAALLIESGVRLYQLQQ